METMALSQTRGYRTGGTVHFIVNNQIGFTTSDTRDAAARSIAPTSQDDRGAGLPRERRRPRGRGLRHQRPALDFRMQFHKDVVIDIVCFRRSATTSRTSRS
jgi:2-oxoglutarate dehydrogenase E1 component